MGHYSNPPTERTGEARSGQLSGTPPAGAPHRAQRRLRAGEVDTLVDGYHVGDTIMQLARRFGISRTTVMAHLDRRSVRRRATAKEWNDDALSRAAASYADGRSLACIADEFGLDPSTVANCLRKAGVPIRPRRGWY
jgi:DNA-binding CsgD family transcriptional regulator